MFNVNTLTLEQYRAALLSFIREVEGVRPAAYLDDRGFVTIGIGFVLKNDDLVLQTVLAAFGLDVSR